jgi:hypothetical protein
VHRKKIFFDHLHPGLIASQPINVFLSLVSCSPHSRLATATSTSASQSAEIFAVGKRRKEKHIIKIENKKRYRGEGIYIGRPSLLGNPFEIGVHGGRGDVIRLYRRWLWNRILEQGEVYAELKRLAKLAKQGDLTLICWCVPNSCHGHYGETKKANGQCTTRLINIWRKSNSI